MSFNVNDGTLDSFILAYCEKHGIECDGGVFSVFFSGSDDFDEDEAA